MKMTKVQALYNVLNGYDGMDNDTRWVLEGMVAQLEKPRKSSDEAKAKAKAKRADARSALLAQVLPILRDTITTDMTAKEIFAAASGRLPKDFTDKKVQYILLNEMKDEVVKTEAKGKPNTYRLK